MLSASYLLPGAVFAIGFPGWRVTHQARPRPGMRTVLRVLSGQGLPADDGQPAC